MGSSGKQVKNGKAFEYAILTQYVSYLKALGLNIRVLKDAAYNTAKLFYEEKTPIEKTKFDESAKATIDTIIKLEPGLTAAKNESEEMIVSLAMDSNGQKGDVRDVIFKRPQSKWEIGFSAKNNHDAVKHSRLSNLIDFGKSWFDMPCSPAYWENVNPIFDLIRQYKADGMTWRAVPNKESEIYIPLLRAFKEEMLRLNTIDASVPKKLIKYLIGQYPFYKIIKKLFKNIS